MSTTVPTASCPGINYVVSHVATRIETLTNGELGNELSLVDVSISTTNTTDVDY
jgi:hypothetical protein